MTVAELREHIARLGGVSRFARALGCHRSSVHRWAKGTAVVGEAWADRIRALRSAPRPAAKPPAPPIDPRQLRLPMGLDAAPSRRRRHAEARA
jgi:DNA-binding transcriptional regulator YdaS (Cro superfamily)